MRPVHTPVGLTRIEDITRREFMFSALGAALLIACGDDEDDGGEASGETRTIVHKFGETLVPMNPKRVVSVGWDEHDFLLGFGIVPIMQRDAWGNQPYGTWPWAQPALGTAQPEIITEEIPFEQIINLKPDLIMATWAGLTRDEYDRLSQIAPTVAQHPDYEDWEAPWDVRTLRVGQIFGKEEEAQKAIQAVVERIARIKKDHPEWQGLVVSPATVEDGTFSVATPRHSRGQLMVDLGFDLPQDVIDAVGADELHAQFSWERLQMIDTDVIIWVNGADDASAVLDLPLRKGLKAHQEGREVYCDKVLTAAFSIQSVLSFNYLLDKLVPELEAAVDGDPATEVQLAAQYGLTS